MKEKIKKLSIEEKVGQMFIVGINTSNPISLIEEYILKNKVGGILLYKKNYKDNKELIKLINDIKKINKVNSIPIFIATDQEGGRVNRMPKEFLTIPSAYKLASNQEDLVKKTGEITGELLQKFGFNLNFAPVLDIKRFKDQHAIGDRAFSTNKEIVYQKGLTYLQQLKKFKILPVVKHFPGHGTTTKDSHFGIPVIKEKEKQQMEEEDKYPFEKIIKHGVNAILVGHLKIEKQTEGLPATMSRKFITKQIRKKYHYKGLIITDDMRMRAIKRRYGKKEAIKKAFFAGYDMIITRGIEKDTVIQEIVEKVKKDQKIEARVNRSVNRILKIKQEQHIKDELIELPENLVEEINEKIKEIRMKVGIKE